MRTIREDLLDLAGTIGWPESTLTQLGGNVLGLVQVMPVLDHLYSYTETPDWPKVEVTVTIDGGITVSGCTDYVDPSDEHDHTDDPTSSTDEDDQVAGLIQDVRRDTAISLGY